MNQGRLRHKIANLERMQQDRRNAMAQKKIDMDTLLELKQREIENLKAQLTIGVAR